jgi:exopolysaccharide biosynthesis polyprenyl glycosylphosphotransferase
VSRRSATAGDPRASVATDRGESGSPGLAQAAQTVRTSRAVRQALARERRVEGRLQWMHAADAGILLSVMCFVNLARFGTSWPTYPASHYAVGFSLATGIHLAVYYFSGLYEPQPRLGAQPWLPRVARATLVALLLSAAVALLTGRYLMPRGNLLAVFVLASLAITALRHIQRGFEQRRSGPPRVFLIGTPDVTALAQAHLAESDRYALVVGAAEDAASLVARVRGTGATDVLLLTGSLLESVYPGPLAELEAAGVNVLQRVTGAQTLLGLQSVREVGGMPFVALKTHTLPLSQARLKRYLELILLLVASPVVIPLTAAVALYVRVVAGSPVLFRQRRVGRDGVVFSMAKFRTMRPAEDGAPAMLTERDDPRVIPACRLLRCTRLDELPQLWHVLRGQMSLVGPRPERPELTADFERQIPGYSRRYEIPPGITGLAQVHGRYHTDPEYKLGHDLQYLVNWSPARDLQILGQTLWVVAARRL